MFMNRPNEEHLKTMYCILRYLKMTPQNGIPFQKGLNEKIEVQSDANWLGSVTNWRFTNLVTWRSKKVSSEAGQKQSVEPCIKAIENDFGRKDCPVN